MNCPHCGVQLPQRPTTRVIMTGILLVAAGLLLVLLVHLAVVVLASVILLAVGGSFLTGAAKARVARCPSCGHPPTLRRG